MYKTFEVRVSKIYCFGINSVLRSRGGCDVRLSGGVAMLMEQMPTGKRTRPHGDVCEILPPDVDTNILSAIGMMGFLLCAPMRSLRRHINMATSSPFFRWIMSISLYAYRVGLMRNKCLNKHPIGVECIKDNLCIF